MRNPFRSIKMIIAVAIMSALAAMSALSSSFLRIPSKTKKPDSFLGGSLINIGFVNSTNCWVGNPNSLNRRDRVVFQFDLREYLQEGKVKKAMLVLPLKPFGILKANWLELECFKTERYPVSEMDIISNKVFPVAMLLIDHKSTLLHNIDVTKMVNSALNRGDGTIAFRVRNATIEKVGNRQNKPEGASINFNQLKLEIVE